MRKRTERKCEAWKEGVRKGEKKKAEKGEDDNEGGVKGRVGRVRGKERGWKGKERGRGSGDHLN